MDMIVGFICIAALAIAFVSFAIFCIYMARGKHPSPTCIAPRNTSPQKKPSSENTERKKERRKTMSDNNYEITEDMRYCTVCNDLFNLDDLKVIWLFNLDGLKVIWPGDSERDIIYRCELCQEEWEEWEAAFMKLIKNVKSTNK